MIKMNDNSNSRIAKNTAFLYFRTLFNIVVGLYTSRVILQTLGVEDFGIYNVVGGIVMMFSFINSGMVAATQRFISYELGRKNAIRLNQVFSMAILVHFLLAILIFLLAETFGLYFLNFHMNIAPERMYAANWVYQCSILSFILSVVSVPYSACIISHEHMKVYAYISILDHLLKLLAVLVLPFFFIDKLIVYAVLLFSIAFFIRIVNTVYCKRHFGECRFKYVKDKQLFREMFSFAGWSFLGNLGFSVKDQGINILVNLFFGTAINAARGIAYQVSAVVSGFMANFQMAMNPQITKRFAAGEVNSMLKLAFCGSRYSFFLLMLIAIPFYIRAPYVLELWLGNVPPYTIIFLRLVLVMLLVDSMANSLVVAMQATGKIRDFQIVISIIMLANLPISYVILKIGADAYSVMYVAIATSFIGLLARLYLLHRLVRFRLMDFILGVILRNLFVCLLAVILPAYISHYLPDNFGGLLLVCIVSLLSSLITIYVGGLQNEERTYLLTRINKIVRYRTKK